MVDWWVWTILLTVVSFLIGMAAIPSGIGGGVLFVPLVAAFFPYNIDYIRAAGLFISLAGALTSLPTLFKHGLADVRTAIPPALVASAASLFGAFVGLKMDSHTVNTVLGIVVLLIALLMMVDRTSKNNPLPAGDFDWGKPRNFVGLSLFLLIGFMAGMFGIGAGWGNVAVLNLVAGLPIKLAAGTSSFIIGVSASSAGWFYLLKGAFLPLVVIPAAIGMSLGSRVGVRFLATAKPRTVRILVVVALVLAGVRSLLKGLSLWN